MSLIPDDASADSPRPLDKDRATAASRSPQNATGIAVFAVGVLAVGMLAFLGTITFGILFFGILCVVLSGAGLAALHYVVWGHYLSQIRSEELARLAAKSPPSRLPRR